MPIAHPADATTHSKRQTFFQTPSTNERACGKDVGVGGVEDVVKGFGTPGRVDIDHAIGRGFVNEHAELEDRAVVERRKRAEGNVEV